MAEWQPIDTAPRDGTPILLAGGEDDNTKYATELEAAKMRSPCRGWWHHDGWIITLAEACCISVGRDNPTHWMPLPEPPPR